MIDAELTQPVPPPPEAVHRLVPPDLAGDPTSLRHPEVAELLSGMVWGRLGEGRQAWAWFDRVHAAELRSWVLAERGRILRELGLHEESEHLDTEALMHAFDLEDMVRARASLVADAVGRGEFEVARLRLQGLDALLERAPRTPGLDRQRLRRAWVAVEVALVHGEPPPVDGLPHLDGGQVWFPPEQVHGTSFHAAKGLLFGAIAHDEPTMLELAAADAPPALLWAVRLAQADRGNDAALRLAREAWRALVPPAEHAEAAAATPTARRLR